MVCSGMSIPKSGAYDLNPVMEGADSQIGSSNRPSITGGASALMGRSGGIEKRGTDIAKRAIVNRIGFRMNITEVIRRNRLLVSKLADLRSQWSYPFVQMKD